MADELNLQAMFEAPSSASPFKGIASLSGMEAYDESNPDIVTTTIVVASLTPGISHCHVEPTIDKENGNIFVTTNVASRPTGTQNIAIPPLPEDIDWENASCKRVGRGIQFTLPHTKASIEKQRNQIICGEGYKHTAPPGWNPEEDLNDGGTPLPC